jgi:hypothetical protein
MSWCEEWRCARCFDYGGPCHILCRTPVSRIFGSFQRIAAVCNGKTGHSPGTFVRSSTTRIVLVYLDSSRFFLSAAATISRDVLSDSS